MASSLAQAESSALDNSKAEKALSNGPGTPATATAETCPNEVIDSQVRGGLGPESGIEPDSDVKQMVCAQIRYGRDGIRLYSGMGRMLCDPDPWYKRDGEGSDLV